MPIVDVTYTEETVTERDLHRLASVLPDVVSEAVACPEEPWLGRPEKGDINIFFKARGPVDVFDLDCIIEVRTKLFPSRAESRQERCTLIKQRLTEHLPGRELGVWLILSEGAWDQS